MEKDLQRKYLQLQLLKQQMNAFLEEKAALDERIAEINMTINAMDKIKKLKKEQEIWSPLGSTVFIKSGINDTGKVLVGIGAGVIVNKNIDEAVVILQKRIDDFSKADQEMVTEINKFANQIAKLEPEVQKMIQEQEEQKDK